MSLSAPILTVNLGSSSLKAGLYGAAPPHELLAAAHLDRIGLPEGRLTTTEADGRPALDRAVQVGDHAAAVRTLLEWFDRRPASIQPGVVAHRIVHGGRFTDPELITSDLVAELRQYSNIDPQHMPPVLDAIDQISRHYRGVPQVAAFDTAFHARMPAVAQLYPLPRRFRDQGVRRYGFHGLSCESVMDTLGTPDDRLVIAHLGNGASLTAVHHGRSVDTTMGFSPAGGIVMGSRTGDLDPGVLLYALRRNGMNADALTRLVNREGGLTGISETSSDMRDLLAREASDPRAADAIALFCYSARKALGGLVAVLGGLDTLVFTGGIGEHAASIRERIVSGLGGFGISIDRTRNDAPAPVISPEGSPVVVRVVPSDEDRVLARHAAAVARRG
jgi:acetate kinase